MMKNLSPVRALLALTLLPLPTPSAGPPRPWPLSEAGRSRLDRVARRQALEGVAEEKFNLAGKLPAWFLARLELPAEEEQRRSQAVHEAWVVRNKVVAPGAGTRKSFALLLRTLPAHLRPSPFRWTLTLHASDRPALSTPGGGHVHVSTGLVRALLADPARGESALAFLIAREIGHVSLGHSRVGWQRQVLEEQARKKIAADFDASDWSVRLQTRVARVGQMIYFLYSRDQEYAADLFALHLCRNAGIDIDAALDGMRYLAAVRHPGATQRDDFRPEENQRFPGVAYYLSLSADPLVRLKRLLMEHGGQVEPRTDFGLFLFDRRSETTKPLRPGMLHEGDRPIVFVHGMHGRPAAWADCLCAFGERRELLSRPLLVFRYPGNGSLARGGTFLANELRRLVPSGVRPTFVCHSAGGLVFRYHAECLQGPFERAVFLGTPHGGSNLTQLKFLVDLFEFAGILRGNGLASAVAQSVANGRGEVGFDLHPDSLFLRYLGRKAARVDRYHIIYGECLTSASAIAMRLAFAAAVGRARKRWVPRLPEGVWREQAGRLFDRLDLPPEVLRGDGVVRSRSALLPGVAGPMRTRRTHLAMRHDPEVIRQVLAWVTRPGGP